MNQFTAAPTTYYMDRVRRARRKRTYAMLRLVGYCLLAIVAVPLALFVGIGWISGLG